MELNRDSRVKRRVDMKPTAVMDDELISDNASQSDLSRFCLELDPVESKRVLAWVNSICLLYLVIGIMGLKPPAVLINRRPLTEEEAVPTIIEPLITPVQMITPDSNPEQVNEQNPEEAGVAVTVDSAAVAFSVPTVGNVLVSLSMAQAPPAHPMQGAVPISTPHIEQISMTGIGGSRPPPSYPYESRKNKEEGAVVLFIEVNESGRVTSVTVQGSSGHIGLDKAAAEHVRRTWYFGPAKSKHLYECPIIFQLQ